MPWQREHGWKSSQKNVINNTHQNSKLLVLRPSELCARRQIPLYVHHARRRVVEIRQEQQWGYFLGRRAGNSITSRMKLNVFDEFKIRASWGLAIGNRSTDAQPLRYREILVRGTNGRRLSVLVMRPAARVPTTAISLGRISNPEPEVGIDPSVEPGCRSFQAPSARDDGLLRQIYHRPAA